MSPVDSVIRIIHPHEDDDLFDLAHQAAADALLVVTNGTRTMLCSVIPKGWKVFPINLRRMPEARLDSLEATGCMPSR